MDGILTNDEEIIVLLDDAIRGLADFIESHGLLDELSLELLTVITIARMNDE